MAEDDSDGRARARAEGFVGRKIDGRYKVGRVLAMGGMGAVYEARHLKLKKRVALKILHPAAEADGDLVKRFEREALVGGHVAHEHLAAATDFGDLPDGTRFLVMELVRGQTLRALMDGGPLEVDRAASIIRQIAVALAALHDGGIIHRDLKPRNVMLTDEDFVKLVDFGLSKIDRGRLSTLTEEEADGDARLTAGGVVFGTFGHLAPEAADGMENVDARADLYALGVMAFEMVAGKHPFDAKSDIELFLKQRTLAVPSFADRAPGIHVPPAFEVVVRKLLERDPEDRFPNAKDAIAAIDEAVPSASHAPPPPMEPSVPSMVDPAESGALDVSSLSPPPEPGVLLAVPLPPDKAAVLGEVKRLGFGCAVVALFMLTLVLVLMATCNVR